MKKVKRVLLVVLTLSIIGAPIALGIALSDNDKLEDDLKEYRKQVADTTALNVRLSQKLAFDTEMAKYAKDSRPPRNSKGQFTSKGR